MRTMQQYIGITSVIMNDFMVHSRLWNYKRLHVYLVFLPSVPRILQNVFALLSTYDKNNDSVLIKTHEERKPNCTVKCIKM